MSFPRLEIMVPPLRRNMRVLLEKGRERNVETVAVTKGFCADRAMVEMLWEAGYRRYADANLNNLLQLREWLGDAVELQLIRVPMMTELYWLVDAGVVPHVSHREVLMELDVLSRRCGKVTRVYLAVETGDGREGFHPGEVMGLRHCVQGLTGIHIMGLSTALACLSGVLPDPEVMVLLRDLKKDVSESFGRDDLRVSVGGTTFLSLWEQGDMPTGVNEIRCGEAWLFGTDISRKQSFSWLEQNTFFFTAEIVEVNQKSPKRTRDRGYDAFGRLVGMAERQTNRTQALVACGLQDTDETQLYLDDDRVTIVGATSNYLVLDVEKSAEQFFPGKIFRFRAGYGAVLRAYLSPYVDKVYVQHEKVVDDESGISRERFS